MAPIHLITNLFKVAFFIGRVISVAKLTWNLPSFESLRPDRRGRRKRHYMRTRKGISWRKKGRLRGNLSTRTMILHAVIIFLWELSLSFFLFFFYTFYTSLFFQAALPRTELPGNSIDKSRDHLPLVGADIIIALTVRREREERRKKRSWSSPVPDNPATVPVLLTLLLERWREEERGEKMEKER